MMKNKIDIQSGSNALLRLHDKFRIILLALLIFDIDGHSNWFLFDYLNFAFVHSHAWQCRHKIIGKGSSIITHCSLYLFVLLNTLSHGLIV